jgi:hypothetical protein
MSKRDNETDGNVKNQSGANRKGRRRVLLIAAGCFVVLCVVAVAILLILYKDINYRCCIELGTPMPPADVFSKDSGVTVKYITDTSGINITETGDHWIHVAVNGSDRLVDIAVQDTIAPVAQPVELSISIKDTLTPDKLVSSLSDEGPVKLQWEKAPQFGTAGDYPVVIEMRDMSGNTSSLTSTLHIRAAADTLEYEAGSALPTINGFLFDKTLEGKLVTDISTLTLDKPGQYDVSTKINGVTYTTKLIVKDTVKPELTLHMAYISPGGQVKPEDFVSSATDATALAYKFVSEPDPGKTGIQDVSITATDLGGNTAEAAAKLLVSKIAPVTVEIRNTPLTAADFPQAAGTVAFPAQTIPDKLGEYEVGLTLNGEPYLTLVTVADTTPPTAEVAEVAWYLGHPITADRFVKNAFDYSEITYSFKSEPDWNKSGVQNVSVKLTDAAGNSSEYNSALTLGKDTEAPTLYNVKNRYCYIGQAVAYFAEVSAKDNCDSDVHIDVDNSQVDINKGGKYDVSYTATDSSGNSVTKKCILSFVEPTVTDEELNAAADQLLAKITTPDMSIGKKAYAIWKWVNKHVRYRNKSNKTDWRYEAYRGITAQTGDCFTFFSTSKILLQRIGAKTIDVQRHGGKPTHHFWLLVNLGTGWYHFDAIDVGPRNYECFMRTDAEVLKRSGNYFWSFDRSLYPPSPKEKYVMN